MLPQDQSKNKPTPMTVGGDDLMGEAVSRSMSRLINAIHSQNVADAVEAWKTLCALADTDDY